MATEVLIPTPSCRNMIELPPASRERARLNQQLLSDADIDYDTLPPLSKHIALGLAITTGSALGEVPPSLEQCFAAFSAPNSAGLSAGARAWTKHAHRSDDHDSRAASGSWWGQPKGSVTSLNASAINIFEKIVQASSWRNLHWLPHMVLVYEIRVAEGYGMRWSQDRLPTQPQQEWVFRGFVEPMMVNGHELRWRH